MVIHRLTDAVEAVSDMFLLSESQMERIRPFFPLAHGAPRVDDRRVLSGIVYVVRNGLQWKDAPKAYGPQKILEYPLWSSGFWRPKPIFVKQGVCEDNELSHDGAHGDEDHGL